MYKIVTVEDTVRVPPARFSEDLETVITQELENMVVGRIDKSLGVVLAVTGIDEVGDGKIILGDGAVYYSARFKILVYEPMVNEVVEGEVTEVTEFGVFVGFGPIDGLIHVSQITEDFMSYDQKNSSFVGRESNKILKVADVVQARIVTVSMKSRATESKIGLTMRQPYLGKLEWIEDDRKKLEEKIKAEDNKEKEKEKKKGGKKEGDK
ncbi:MAG: DNA-directed RNA polymerase [Candidatus Altiarchaeales archaeon]|nr:DNA-directed RNA polymerase [Candidatus Altiarchaeales archaeon]MBD3415751.1 DNA-directed RNA polymerase [Candidatus Altiarchaeales archaeon]